MRLSNRLMQASWWEGLVPDHWLVELGLAPRVGRAVLRKTLSSLSSDVWACIPALLVIWPDVSQHCWVRLGLGEEMVASKRAHISEYSPKLWLPVSLSSQ